MKTREAALKTFLWAVVGVLAAVTAVRFVRGLGAATALSDAAPWGFWIAFDVMAGVALAAGGFVIAGTVYIFGRTEYRPLTRPAILTAFLGYAAVVMGLLYDLGLPWNIWHPIVSPQPHSVLFEVAMCVMLYLTVLFLEFGPVMLEHPRFRRAPFPAALRILKSISIPLVIAGIVLSTLHQSSLGSLFLIAPHRLHPLWYSPIIWVLFFVSAIGLGLMMVTAESLFSSWLFGHRLRMKQLSGLGRAASCVLLAYAALRLGDLALRGSLGALFAGAWQSHLFIAELAISALVPGALLLSGAVRNSPAGLAACSGMTILGMIGYRFNTCIVAFARPEGMPYVPSWMEVAVSVGIVAGAMLVFIFFAEHLKVYPDEPARTPESPAQELDRDAFHPSSTRILLPHTLADPRRYSLAAVAAAAIAIAVIPRDALVGSMVARTPVSPARTMAGFIEARTDTFPRAVGLAADSIPQGAQETRLVVIDGNRDGRFVLFPHEHHADTLGGRTACAACHHQNKPFDEHTACFECHRDMYTVTDIFDHSLHGKKLGGNGSCVRCHADPAKMKTRKTAASCAACHAGMDAGSTIVARPEGGSRGFAAGYMDAMHGLCISCHGRLAREQRHRYGARFGACGACHRDSDLFRPLSMEPYAARQRER